MRTRRKEKEREGGEDFCCFCVGQGLAPEGQHSAKDSKISAQQQMSHSITLYQGDIHPKYSRENVNLSI